MKKIRAFVGGLAAILVLAGCGAGGGDLPTPSVSDSTATTTSTTTNTSTVAQSSTAADSHEPVVGPVEEVAQSRRRQNRTSWSACSARPARR